MIKILILSRTDFHWQLKDIPQDKLQTRDANPEVQPQIDYAHYALIQEGDGPVTVLKDRSDYPIKTLLEEVIKELPKA
jgi:hypothetical protein